MPQRGQVHIRSYTTTRVIRNYIQRSFRWLNHCSLTKHWSRLVRSVSCEGRPVTNRNKYDYQVDPKEHTFVKFELNTFSFKIQENAAENAVWIHDDVIKWKHFPRYWPFVQGIHRSPVNSPHKGQWRGVLMFSLICGRINSWVNNGEAGDLRRIQAHCDVIVMNIGHFVHPPICNGRRNCFTFKFARIK